jgi:CDP-glucose 4,6-dehydratase
MVSTEHFWEDRRIFLTGHTGFKGAWLCIWLKTLGAKVFGFALNPTTTPSLFLEADVARRIDSSIIADIRDPHAIRRALAEAEADIVIHLAAQPLVRESYTDPVGTFATNIMGTVNILEATRTCPSVRAVVNVTTDKVYENKEWMWAYRENEPLGGYDPYSSSKTCSEIVTASYRDSFFQPKDRSGHGVSIATARSGNVIGGGDWAHDRLVPDCIRAFQKKEQVRIRYPQATRPWQHVLEPLAGYLALARKLFEEGQSLSGAWNFGPAINDSRPVETIVERLVQLWGPGASYAIDEGENPHESVLLSLDNTKAFRLLSWKPRMKVDTALEMTVLWFKEHFAGGDAYALCRAQIEAYGALS